MIQASRYAAAIFCGVGYVLFAELIWGYYSQINPMLAMASHLIAYSELLFWASVYLHDLTFNTVLALPIMAIAYVFAPTFGFRHVAVTFAAAFIFQLFNMTNHLEAFQSVRFVLSTLFVLAPVPIVCILIYRKRLFSNMGSA